MNKKFISSQKQQRKEWNYAEHVLKDTRPDLGFYGQGTKYR